METNLPDKELEQQEELSELGELILDYAWDRTDVTSRLPSYEYARNLASKLEPYITTRRQQAAEVARREGYQQGVDDAMETAVAIAEARMRYGEGQWYSGWKMAVDETVEVMKGEQEAVKTRKPELVHYRELEAALTEQPKQEGGK